MKGLVTILVLGKESVGKTAVVVRFLTGRYLSEYAHAPETTYERSVTVEGRQVPLKIVDISGKNLDPRAGNKELLNKVDGVMVVYDVTDRHSFDLAEGIIEWLRSERKPATQLPVLLLGNKADLTHVRCVHGQKDEEVDDLEWRSDGFLATECSASTDDGYIVQVFNALVTKILEKRELGVKQPRKLSQNPLGSPKIIRATLKRRFSMFNRERTSTM